MRETVGPEMGVKASGGVRTRSDAEAMVAAGATRIGASAGVKIVRGEAGRVERLLSAAVDARARVHFRAKRDRGTHPARGSPRVHRRLPPAATCPTTR